MTGGRGLDPETIIVTINTRIRAGGHVDWVMPLFSAFLLEEKSAEDVKDMLIGYRDKYPDHLPAHEHLLDFLHQEYSDDPDIILPHLKFCLEKFPCCLDYALRYCEMLIKSLEDEDLDESFESEISNEEDAHRRSSREPDVHREIVRVLVSCLDYRTLSDNLVLWTYLTESLKYLCFKSPEVTTFARELFKDRMGWWSKQNFRCESQCSDEVIVKKAIICALLHSTEDQRFKTMALEIEERKRSTSSAYFVNLARELDSIVPRISAPLLPSVARPIILDETRLRDEWAKIKTIKLQQEPEGKIKTKKK